jgi:AraC-like DNA-binding protein
MRASDQILEYLDAPKREDKYHRTALDEMRLGDVNTDRLQHYLACRRQLEEHLDEESVFDELCRQAMQSDEETCDWFDRVTSVSASDAFARDTLSQAQRLAAEATSTTLSQVGQDRLARIANGMLSDGWPEHEVAFALGTLGADA